MATFVRELARPLPAIHAVAAPAAMRGYEPYFASDGSRDRRACARPLGADPSTVWERAFEAVAAEPPERPEPLHPP